ncbi:MAG: hypothetical protein QXS20_02810 [Candidatus Thorarchaeota archaeon]
MRFPQPFVELLLLSLVTLCPIAIVEWRHLNYGLHDTSVYLLFNAYSVGRGTFGIYDHTGFGPFALSSILTVISLVAASRASLVAVAWFSRTRRTDERWTVVVGLAAVVIEVAVTLSVFGLSAMSLYEVTVVTPLPIPGLVVVAIGSLGWYTRRARCTEGRVTERGSMNSTGTVGLSGST